jgi:hypothetical protein
LRKLIRALRQKTLSRICSNSLDVFYGFTEVETTESKYASVLIDGVLIHGDSHVTIAD